MKTPKLSFSELQQTTLLNMGCSSYLEQQYHDYLEHPDTLLPEWRDYFAALPLVDGHQEEVDHTQIKAAFKQLARHPITISTVEASSRSKASVEKQTAVSQLIDAYRLLGHLQADIDPLETHLKPDVPELMLSYYHLQESDLDEVFDAGSLPGPKTRTLKQIILDLKKCYCGTLAAEFMHIPDSPERLWVEQHVEEWLIAEPLPKAIQQRLLGALIAADGLEKYLGAKYPGAKRFSLEGNDSLLVALDTLIQVGGQQGVSEVIIGMAHRGRLNVLVNLLGKKPEQLFDEFEGKHYDTKLEAGDVKYHQGFTSNVSTPGGNVHLSLAFNPSHLEIITPVVLGSVEARQMRYDAEGRNGNASVLSVAIHGDSAFSGQGVVMESLNMSETPGFSVGGSIHIIVNNQIGFTTSDSKETRSTLYCSDIGKMMGVPIFHINADDPEAVYRVMLFALLYRAKFKKDVIIDLIGYRRHGHNEADEPMVTQPVMYRNIKALKPVATLYAEQLIQKGFLSNDEFENKLKAYRNSLDFRAEAVAPNVIKNLTTRPLEANWADYLSNDWETPIKTGISLAELKTLSEKQTTLPNDFVLHPRVKKVIEDRIKMTEGSLPLDWGYAENLAYATLLNEGYLVRLSGQDVGRGTFFHRHAVLHNQENNDLYIPLQHLSPSQGKFVVVNSLLSENAVMAFEYGFASTEPKGLVIWEAQFGDFANNGQVVIDQFISSGEQKWGRLCGLTLYLPHGYEGQGAEHSSARLERYLQLCAQHNMQVCAPTTPAQLFHLLRRQVLRTTRKPLILMTPKSFLRHPLAVSSLEQLEQDSFLSVIPETETVDPNSVQQVILCSGKVYYDLVEKRKLEGLNRSAIIRVEELYPFPGEALKTILSFYTTAKDVVWCQEEPKNQGAWSYIKEYLLNILAKDQSLRYAGRPLAAAPAVGYLHLHQQQQKDLLAEAFSKGKIV